MKQQNKYIKALIAAFPYTIPIFAGYAFLGLSYGIYMTSAGFSFLYPMLMSITVFGGSMQFVAVSMLIGAFNPLQTLAMTLMLNARHLFYGISMLDRYKGVGKKKLYMIFGLVDETFSINCMVDVPEGVDRGWFMFFVTLLDHCYWILGSTVGGLFGSIVPFSTEGIDFVMTAMFVVIFMEQWLKEKNHAASLFGLGLSMLSLIVFGRENFIIPAMAAILLVLTLIRKKLEKGGEAE